MKFIDYGLGAFTAEAFDRVPADAAFDLAELYGKILADRELAGFEMTNRFYEIGSPAGLEETARFISSQGVGKA
jgi:NDP-sugar pyrophosphorylase family protein